MITDKCLEAERPHPGMIGGVQRIYRCGNWGLSVVNASMLHAYPYAWEAAVTHYIEGSDNWTLTYKTPLTNDVVIFDTDEAADEWIKDALAWMEKNPTKPRTMASVRAEKAARTRKMARLALE